MRPRALAIALAWVFALAAGPVAAGSVEGPYVIWVNLGTNRPQDADEQIRAFVDGADRLCWPDGALLYMRQRPPALTPALARRAVLRREPAALQQVRAILRRPFDGLGSFDGLIVYSDEPAPRLSSVSVGGLRKSEMVRGPGGEAAWGATFCNVLPAVSRRP